MLKSEWQGRSFWGKPCWKGLIEGTLEVRRSPLCDDALGGLGSGRIEGSSHPREGEQELQRIQRK